jgi:hypothetical protein
MRRILLLPLVPAIAWSQQASTTSQAPVSEAESALRARVDEFYRLLVDKKFRQAESLVVEDSKDLYYNWGKPDIKGFDIKSVELLDGGRAAKVAVTVKMFMAVAGAAPVVFNMPSPSTWHLEQGKWSLWIDPNIVLMTPMGKIPSRPQTTADSAAPAAPPTGIDAVRNQVLLDHTEVTLTSDVPTQTVTILNPSAGPVDLTLDEHSRGIRGLVTEIATPHLGSLEQGSVLFRVEKGVKMSETVKIVVAPQNQILEIRVTAK